MNFARLWGRRPYRFDGERENHAEQLRERTISLSLMASADAADPDQKRMASEIEHDAEARLTVLLGKPLLTLEEKRERDAIQGALQRRRQSFDTPGPSSEIASVAAPRRFLGGLATGAPWLAIVMSPFTWLAMGLAAFGLQTARLNHAKAELVQARHDVRAAVQIAHDWEARANDYRQGLIDAAAVAHQAAAALDAERQAQARAAARERRRNREIANVLAHSPEPPAWRLRDDEPAADQPAAPSP